MKIINQNTLVNLSNSLLKHYHVPTFHPSIIEIDNVLKTHKKIVVLLFDGLGEHIINSCLKDTSYIRRHSFMKINSVFPPTTAAATTAFLSAKYPIQTGWCSWSQYFKEFKRNIVLFRNKDHNTDEQLDYCNGSVANTYFPYENIFTLINKYNPSLSVECLMNYPIKEDGHKSLKDGYQKLDGYLKDKEECFAYFYFEQPDATIHHKGVHSFKTKYWCRKIDNFIKKITKNNPDTLFISIADHGLVNVKYIDLCQYQDLYSLITSPVALEARVLGFYVKEENRKKFETLFNQYLGDKFKLFYIEEALKEKLFGEGEVHPKVVATLGDYIAVATSEYCLYPSKEYTRIHLHKGHHAGGTKEERIINLSIYND